MCSEHTVQLYHSTTQCTVPRVLTTIHWIPNAKDLCRSQTHLKRKIASTLSGGWQCTTSHPQACSQVLAQPPAMSLPPRVGSPAQRQLVLLGTPARTLRDLQSSTAACCKGRFWTRVKPRPGAYRKVAVSAGMLLRNVKIITTNTKTRRRDFL